MISHFEVQVAAVYHDGHTARARTVKVMPRSDGQLGVPHTAFEGWPGRPHSFSVRFRAVDHKNVRSTWVPEGA